MSEQMELQFEVVESVGTVVATVYDVSGEEKVVAGTVRVVYYNGGTTESLEPFNFNGERIGNGNSKLEDHIETVKRAYENRLLRLALIEEKWNLHEELANELNIDKELFEEYGNVRIYLSNLSSYKVECESFLKELNELILFRDSEAFDTLPVAVQKVLFSKIKSLKNEVAELEKQMENQKEYISAYK